MPLSVRIVWILVGNGGDEEGRGRHPVGALPQLHEGELGFAKNERENIERDELEDLRAIAADVLTAAGLQRLLAADKFRRLVMTKKAPSRLREAINDTAEDMCEAGVMDRATFEKITLRHLGLKAPATAEPITGAEIRAVRERAHLSQAALARYLNLTTGYVSQLERGTKEAKGPALAVLNILRRKGIEAFQ